MKKLKTVLSLSLAALLVCVSLFTGCKNYTVDEGAEAIYNCNTDFAIEGSADDDTIYLEITTNSTDEHESGEIFDVVMLKTYEYYDGEEDLGINYETTEFDEGTTIGEYVVGEEKTLKIERVSGGGYDNLYCKFVLAQNGKLVAGPFYVTEVSSKSSNQNIEAKSIKGILGEIDEETVALGCSWTEYNFYANSAFYPNEYVDDDGNIVEFDNSSYVSSGEAITFESNGKTYYFRSSFISTYDTKIRYCYENGIQVVLIIYNLKIYDQSTAPYFMSYAGARDYTSSTIWAIDTSTELGAGYFTALMEFLAERYSREDGAYGYCHRFVIGNEIDISTQWNPVVNYSTTEALELNDYVEEYARTLRLAEQATKKYCSDNMVLVSTCHYWYGRRSSDGTYASKLVYDYLNAKVSYQGNFNWGMASHPYPVDLGDANFLLNEAGGSSVTSDYNSSPYITWTNLEILELYLEQEDLLYNGTVRRVYLTEGGVSSGSDGSLNYEKNQNLQAMSIAYSYYKAATLDCVDAYIYYRLVDNSGDGGSCNFGIIKSDGTHKLSYDLFIHLDMEDSFDYSNEYLSYLKYKIDGITYSVSNENITGYYDAMNIVGSSFDWANRWDTTRFVKKMQ